MAADQGYIIIARENNKSPPPELFDKLTDYIGKHAFEFKRRLTLEHTGGDKIDGGQASRELLNHKVDFSAKELDSFFRPVLGDSFNEAKKSEPEVVFFAENPTQQPRYPAGPRRSSVYIWCSATDEELHDGNGLFRIVEGSHIKLRGEIDGIDPTPIRLKPYEILIMSADLIIQYPQGGGGVAIVMRVDRHW
ncbi:hypothetical protein AJ80_09936 [Polytolypa hystricis UAMH7299]|uniref:Uncharacterized protein n=1 Tax=Polytolypa hystricis (strain UAMH7299) TaxID=1447883 RepID=A0A2B7WGE3_POLH7|nr:hypothetical protein AJ80_09936 [Polytolypa hystricis UAMH7299]